MFQHVFSVLHIEPCWNEKPVSCTITFSCVEALMCHSFSSRYNQFTGLFTLAAKFMPGLLFKWGIIQGSSLNRGTDTLWTWGNAGLVRNLMNPVKNTKKCGLKIQNPLKWAPGSEKSGRLKRAAYCSDILWQFWLKLGGKHHYAVIIAVYRFDWAWLFTQVTNSMDKNPVTILQLSISVPNFAKNVVVMKFGTFRELWTSCIKRCWISANEL